MTAAKWRPAETIASPITIDHDRTNATPARIGPSLSAPLPHPDYSTVPRRIRLPWRELAARTAAGDDVVGEVHDRLSEIAGRRASSLAQVVALAAWRDWAVRDSMIKIRTDARALREGEIA